VPTEPTIFFVKLSAEGQKKIAWHNHLVFKMHCWFEQFRHSICKIFEPFPEVSFAYDFDRESPNPLLLRGFQPFFRHSASLN